MQDVCLKEERQALKFTVSGSVYHHSVHTVLRSVAGLPVSRTAPGVSLVRSDSGGIVSGSTMTGRLLHCLTVTVGAGITAPRFSAPETPQLVISISSSTASLKIEALVP